MDLFERTIHKQTAYAAPAKIKVDVKPPVFKKPEVKLDFKPKIPSKSIAIQDDPKTIPDTQLPINPPPNSYPLYKFVEPQVIGYPQISPNNPIKHR